jgi:pimeloyl-ACP methyl ester carboxylesterase
VVMVHGSMDRHASFAGVRRALPEAHVVVYDRRGYGRSRDVPVATSIDDHVADLLEITGERPMVVLGHSYGGCVALRAAEIAPALVRGLVVYEAPLPWLPGWPADTGGGRALAAPDPETAAEAFLRRLLGDARWEGLPERTRRDRRAEGAALVSDMRSVRPLGGGAPVDVARVRQPVIVARGSASAPHHIDGTSRLAALLPDAELVTLDGATHGAHVARPEEMAALVRRVLGRTVRA